MKRLLALVTVLGVAATPAPSLARPSPDDQAPRPTLAWAAGPLEVHVGFDRPLDPAVATSVLAGSIRLGDRPVPNPAADGQGEAIRGSLRIAAARLTGDRRTLMLATDPHPFRASYTAILPGIRAEGGGATIPEVTYTLTGVLSEFDPDGDEPASSLWWPGVDATALPGGSSEHEQFVRRLARPGRLTLRTLVALPEGRATVTLATSGTLQEPTLGGETAEVRSRDDGSRVTLSAKSTGEPMELAFDVTTPGGGRAFRLEARWVTPNNATERPLPPDRLTLPWAPSAPPKPYEARDLPPQMAGGDVARGESVFFGEAAKCSTCHAMKGRGGQVGPDLSELAGRTVASIYHDILEPSATIRPEYVSYTVTTKDGRVLAGIARSEGRDQIRVIGSDAKVTDIARGEIEEIRPSATSIMPVGLPGAIGEAGMKDLLAYLKAAGKVR